MPIWSCSPNRSTNFHYRLVSSYLDYVECVNFFLLSCIIVCYFYSCLWHVSGIALCLIFQTKNKRQQRGCWYIYWEFLRSIIVRPEAAFAESLIFFSNNNRCLFTFNIKLCMFERCQLVMSLNCYAVRLGNTVALLAHKRHNSRSGSLSKLGQSIPCCPAQPLGMGARLTRSSTRPFPTCMYHAEFGRSRSNGTSVLTEMRQKNWPLVSCLSKSLKIIGTNTYRSAT